MSLARRTLSAAEPRCELRRLPAMAFVCACMLLGACTGRECMADLSDEQLLRELRSAADRGDANAQYLLGIAYQKGEVVPCDAGLAAAWYRKAAEQGHAKAQSFLGFCYATGNGVDTDTQTALAWWKKAAAQGDAEALYGMGMSYETGCGMAKNPRLAAEWYRKSAAQGCERAAEALKRVHADE